MHWCGDGEDSQGALEAGAPVTFRCWLILPYVRKTRALLEVFLPWLYLKGISSGEMGEVLGVLPDQDSRGFPGCGVAIENPVGKEA